jgi:hypothetical protein
MTPYWALKVLIGSEFSAKSRADHHFGGGGRNKLMASMLLSAVGMGEPSLVIQMSSMAPK